MEENNQLINQVILCIFGLLKRHMESLLSKNAKDEEIYKNVKFLIIKCIKDKYLKMNNPNNILRKTISDCLTLIIISGIIFNWPTCIKDLINESIHQNIEFCYIVLRALGSIDTLIHYRNEIAAEENDDLIIKSRSNKLQIKEELIKNKDIVINFLLNIYNNINNIQNENLRKIMIAQLFDTTGCWTNFELNLLKNLEISKMIYSIMNKYNIENPQYFSDMICDSISNSKNANIYKNIDINENESAEKLSQELLKSIDLDEKKGLDLLIDFIFAKLEQLKNKENSLNNYESKLFKEFAKILASIIENYIYFFFNFSDKKSAMMLEWFSYFLRYKKRNISWLFFEGLSEMKSFINDYYKFSGLNNQQKLDFINYLMNIVYGVMENCSYKKLDQNDISLLEQEILCSKNELCLDYQKQIQNINENKDLEDFDENEDIDLNEYRTSADSVFSSIFFILIENFKDQGTSAFLNKILSAISLDEINGKSKDQYLDIKIDVIFFVISSVIEIFELEEAENSINIIHKMIKIFMDSRIILENQRLFIDFIVLINKFTKNLVSQPENFKKVMEFLLLISKKSNNKIIIESCYIVLLNICKEINDNIKIDNSFIIEVFNLYKEIYKKYQYPNINPLENIIEIILSITGVNKNKIPGGIDPKENINYDKNLKNIIEQISFPINTQIKNVLEVYIKNQNNQNNLKNVIKLEILKSYFLQGKILELLKEFSKPLSNYFLQVHLKETLNSTKIIFQLFLNDKDIIQPLIDFYTANATDIGDSYQENFNLFNDIMINYFLSSESHYKVVEVIKLLYLSLLIDKTSELYNKNNKYILDQYCLIMNNLINSISKENKVNAITIDKIKILSDFHYYIFQKLYINTSPLISENDLVKYYNFIQNIINFFINCISLFQKCDINEPINEVNISSIIKSFDKFFINISLPKSFLTQNNNNSCLFIDIISSVWNTMSFIKFNCSARKYLIICLKSAMQYDMNLFIIAFEKCISKSPKFTSKYIKPIKEFFQFYQNSPDDIEKMLKFVIDNTPGNANIDDHSFNQLILQMARKKGLKKINK